MKGPNGHPVDLLVQQGDARAQKLARQYPDFARTQVEDIARRLDALTPDMPAQGWQGFYDIIRDLRSSSATCGEEAIRRVAKSWERALDPQYRAEPRLMAVMRLHLDALKLAVTENATRPDLGAMIERLETVVARLNPTAALQD